MKIIYVEGADGIGKTTAIKEFVKKMKDSGYSVYSTREPDYAFRKETLSKKSRDYGYIAKRIMMATSHIEKLEEIKKIRDSGDYDFIIIDRVYVISDYVYGHMLDIGQDFNIVYDNMFPIIMKSKAELKNISDLVILNVKQKTFEERLASRPGGLDRNDTTELKLRVKSKYDELIEGLLLNDPQYMKLRLHEHFNEVYIAEGDDLAKKLLDMYMPKIKGE